MAHDTTTPLTRTGPTQYRLPIVKEQDQHWDSQQASNQSKTSITFNETNFNRGRAICFKNCLRRSNTGIVGSNPTWGMDVCVRLLCVYVVLCADSGLATG
jgi:hypothetical protein